MRDLLVLVPVAAVLAGARVAIIFTGPAWWVALVPRQRRATWRQHKNRKAAVLKDLATRARPRRAARLRRRAARLLARPAIPARLRRRVYAADGYTCIGCGAYYPPHLKWPKMMGLQIDHLIPWLAGGLTSLWNSFTLCGRCNRIKSNFNVDRRGRVHYRQEFTDLAHIGQGTLLDVARRIAIRERQLRWSPGRWARALLTR